MYVVIEFEEQNYAGDNSVAIVRKSWLSPRKREVFWPPIKNQKAFNRTLESETNEDIEKWKMYPVARCLYETDDLEKAKQKLKLSEVTSDLLTDDQSTKQINNKRRKVTPRRYISSSDENEDSDNNHRPPQLNQKLRTILKESQLQGQEISQGKQNSQSYQKPSQEIVEAVVHVTDQPVTIPNNTYENNLQNNLDTHRADIAGNALLGSAGFQDTVVNLLSHIKTQNAQILALLQNKEGVGIKEFPFTFPMKSVEDIEALENLLEDKKQVDALISYLARIGGRDLSSKVSRILKHVILDTLAVKYSFYGKRSNKRPFSELSLKTAILNSVKKSCPTSSDKDIEDSIKTWLKHAPDREKIKIKRGTVQNSNL